MGVSGSLYGDFFAADDYLPWLGAATLGGGGTAAIAALRRWATFRTVLTVGGGFAVLAVYGVLGDTVEHGLPTRATAVELVSGWARMLTVAPPADVRGDLLITPVLITWIAAAAAATVALRTRCALAACAPAVVAFIAALVLVQPAGTQTAVTVALLSITLMVVLLRTIRREASNRRVTMNWLGFGIPVVALVTLVGVLGWQVLPLATGEHRADPRTLLSPPVRITNTLNPLVQIKSQLQEPPRPLFTVRIDGGSGVDRVRTAALDRFDGVQWTSTDRFLVADHDLAADPAMTTARQVTMHVTVTNLAGPFLPALGWPTRLDLTSGDAGRIGVSVDSGVLATSGRMASDFGYALTGVVSDRDSALPKAMPSSTAEYRRYTVLPGNLPPPLRLLAQELTAAESTPYDKLVAIERELRGLPYRLDSPAGHSYAALTRLLTGTGHQDNEGYAEQHATAFAVLARAVGFPTRVAVGYRLPGDLAGTHTVTTHDAHAWAEVHFDRYGWTAFEPTDVTRKPGQSTPAQGATVTPRRPNPPVAAPPAVQPVPDVPGRTDEPSDELVPGWALAAALLVALFVVTVMVTTVEKARRRSRRRRTGDNAARVLGAWHEAVDRLVERGMTVPVSRTALEAADHVTNHVTGLSGATADTLVSLARLSTAAVFAHDEPDDNDVREAWRLEHELRRRLYARRFSPRWLRAKVDPRPLAAQWREARQHRKSLARLGVE
ncbi:hypothetical protein ALI144C_08025 [Actinosynnema sp. ALI-1.44]|nr:hypothetical protein ALI144C_08025 [Actinosynnema sp. ALI-1.44]